MHKMEELKEMLCEELDKIAKKGELSAGSLDVVDKLTHSIKSIGAIMAMEEAEDSGNSYAGGYSNARGQRRDSRGRYSREGGGGSYAQGGGQGGGNRGGGGGQSNRGGSYAGGGRYSRADAMEELVEQLRDLEMSAQDEESRRMVQKWIRQAEMG